jgi:type 1 glutamine amidotransferase/nicotinamidase-related amidase
MSKHFISAAVLLATFVAATVLAVPADPGPLQLALRSRDKSGANVVEKPAAWEPKKTAVVVIDLWDKHWCEGANRRVAEMAPRFSAFVDALRDRGVFVVHAPSDTMKTNEGTPGRKLAQSAPAAEVPEATTFKWNYLDPAAEGQLPIDDSDGGCDCQPQCKNHAAWKAEHPAIHVKEGDAITDNGREVYNLFRARGIENVIVCGVHTNMCVLGRSFGIRQLTRLGFNVALVRDLTDTMYNPRMRPFVPHEKGTELVIEHVEKHWAPTITSDQVLGSAKQTESAKRQAAGAAQGGTTGAEPRILFVLAEDEYFAKDTMPAFASEELTKRFGWKPRILQSDSKTEIPGLHAIDNADLLVLYMRRRELPDEQLNHFKKYFQAGKPVVGVRTASHSFQNWLEFDKLVLGCNYGRHYGSGKDGVKTTITAASKDAASHPILRGIPLNETWQSTASLYRVTPLLQGTTPLLQGKWQDQPPEPVAWTNTHNGGRVFYTSLGHSDDFKDPRFRKLLTNGILWALDKPIPQ